MFGHSSTLWKKGLSSDGKSKWKKLLLRAQAAYLKFYCEYIIMSYIYSILKFYVVEYSPFMKFQMTTLS